MQRPPSGGFCILARVFETRGCDCGKAFSNEDAERSRTSWTSLADGSGCREITRRTGEDAASADCVKFKGLWARSSVGRAMPF